MKQVYLAKQELFMDVYTRKLFIPALIERILSNHSRVLSPLPAACINSATLHQTEKSKDLAPVIGCLQKNGIIFDVISENLITLNRTISSPGLANLPHPKYSVKLSISFSSCECWVNSNNNTTWNPICVVAFPILTKKQPSPDANPASHKPCGIACRRFLVF